MSGSSAVAEATPLLLTIRRVPAGATVHVCPPGSSEPLQDDDGVVPPLRKLVGGIPLEWRLYPVNTLEPSPGGSILTGGYTTAKPGVRFRPVEVFTPDEAPVRTDFAVFHNGKRLKYPGQSRRPPDWRGAIVLYKGTDGRLVSIGHS